MNETKTKTEERKIEEYYDVRSGLWYRVWWDDVLKCYIWVLAPHQRIIVDSTAK